MRAGVADGTIDLICSDHAPVDDDSKQVPFGEAEPGATADRGRDARVREIQARGVDLSLIGHEHAFALRDGIPGPMPAATVSVPEAGK